MFKFKYRRMANLMLTVSILGSVHSFVIAAEDDPTGVCESASSLYDMSASFRRSAIDLLKDNLFTRFRAQNGHREHMEMYDYSVSEIQEVASEVHDWMWNYIKERATCFFEIYDYENCMFDDVLFIGALHDIFINQTTVNRAEQRDFLEILEDSCKYVSYAY